MPATLRQLFFVDEPNKWGMDSLYAQGSARRNPVSGGHGPVSAERIDAAFFGLILGTQSPTDSALNSFEKAVLRDLERLVVPAALADSRLMPGLPALIAQIMGTSGRASPSSIDLATQLADDQVLASKLIQLANAPFYRSAQPIDSLDQAVAVLGRTGVRQLMTRVAFEPLIHLRSGHFMAISGATLWQQAEAAAVAADCMAREEKTDRFKAYLTAMVSSTGLTVLLQVLDRNFRGNLAPRSRSFQQRLPQLARRLSWQIACQWQLPSVILDALEAQTAGLPTQLSGQILYTADRLSKLNVLAGRGRFKQQSAALRRLQWPNSDSFRACYATLTG